MTVEALIRHHRLQPHPEGGWYRELHRSPEQVLRTTDQQSRNALTAILFLLPQGEISRWHRVSHADESWHHAGGAPLELLTLPPEGGALRRQRLAVATDSGDASVQTDRLDVVDTDETVSTDDLASTADLAGRQHRVNTADRESSADGDPLAIVPAGWWQAARSLGAWSLMSCCVGPGFDFADFTLMRDLPASQRPVGALAEFL